MATANPYDPKNRSISKTIYYSHQDNAAVDSSIASSPFPTPYENTVSVTTTTTVQRAAATLNLGHTNFAGVNWSSDDIVLGESGPTSSYLADIKYQGGTHGSSVEDAVTFIVDSINNNTPSGYLWDDATATASGTVITILSTSAMSLDLRINYGGNITAPFSGGTVNSESNPGVDFAVGNYDIQSSTVSQSSRDFADGLVEGGSSYTVQVLQGE